MGDAVCMDLTFDCVETIASVVSRLHGPANTVVEQGGNCTRPHDRIFTRDRIISISIHPLAPTIGVDLVGQNASGIPAAVKAAAGADYVMLVVGIGHNQVLRSVGCDRRFSRALGQVRTTVLTLLFFAPARCRRERRSTGMTLVCPDSRSYISPVPLLFDWMRIRHPTLYWRGRRDFISGNCRRSKHLDVVDFFLF